MESFNVGPLAFSVTSALLIATVVVIFSVGNRIARKSGVNAEPALWTILFVGISSARLAFLMVYWKNYTSNPWTILDIRDGGFNTTVGIAGALIMAILIGFRKQVLRKPLAVSLLAGFTVWAGATALFAQLKKSARLPDVEMADLNGNTVNLADFAGKPLVVNLWATWCPPCRREMPVLRDAQQANPDIVFVFANQGESGATVRSYLQSERLVLDNVLLDPGGALAKKVGSVGLPTTLVFDATGNQVNSRVGAVSPATLEQMTKSVRGGPR